MPNRLLKKWSSAVVLTGAVLAMTAFPAQAHNIDLDTLSVEQLDYYLTLELNAIYTRHGLNPNQAYPLAVLIDEILYALSDEDDDEGDEDVIDMAELVEEMREARTTLRNEVGKALRQADAMAASPMPGMVRVGYQDLEIARNGYVRAAVAVQQTKRILIADIKNYGP